MHALGDGDDNGAHLIFKTTSAAASNDTYNAATVERLRITSTGEVRIPTGSNSTSRLTFGGGINIYHDGNMKFENSTGYLKLMSSNNLYFDGAEFFFRNAAGSTNYLKITSSGNVGINQVSPTHKLEVNGSFAATTKSFVIDHPTKEGMKLRYGSLEGPENGVYVRGRLKDNNTIELPDYWTGLVDEDTITVNLTPIGSESTLHKVVDIYDNTVIINSEDGNINCFYTVFGERKDVEKMEVEY